MSLKEGNNIEFKREFTDVIKKTVIAFANTNGGKLYVGIADNGNIIGIENTDFVFLQITNSIRESIKPDVTLFTYVQIESIDGKEIIKIEVQQGSARPYYLTRKGIKPEGVFVRHGASSVPASEAAIIKMIKETDGTEYGEMRSLQQNLTFSYTDSIFKNANIPFKKEQRRTLGIIDSNNEYTNTALLLSDQCPQSIKIAVFQGKTKSTFKDRKEFSGSVLKQLSDAFEFIDRYNATRSEEHTSELQSHSESSYAVFCSKKTIHSTTNSYALPLSLLQSCSI